MPFDEFGEIDAMSLLRQCNFFPALQGPTIQSIQHPQGAGKSNTLLKSPC